VQEKIAIVTGAYGGLGSELCKLISATGTKLILVDRNLEKSRAFGKLLEATRQHSVLESLAVDLTSHADIKQFSKDLLSRYPKIDYLFNNAGVLTENLQFSQHRNELHFEVNALAPLQLIDQLRPALKAANGAVIVSTSAGLSLGAKTLDWENLVKPKEFKKLYGPYVNSKQALNAITSALEAELLNDRIIVRTADPGPNKTRLTKGKGTPLWMRIFYSFLPSPSKGAQKIFDVAVSPIWGSRSGIFISNGKIQTLPPAVADSEFQTRLLKMCRERAALMN
jgi:NAD(P)-dependent dehydrogenase (short-subunit alcohol dehydrogenase family)